MSIFLEILFWISTCLILHSYLLFPLILYLFVKEKDIRKSTDEDEEGLPVVSFVVSAYNEENIIQQKLENCLRIDYPKDKLEIIIASDGSSDRTAEIVREYNQYNIKLIEYMTRSGKVNVLNRIIPQAKGDIIVLSDANTIYEQDAVRKLVRNFADPKVGCVSGRLLLRAPDGCSGGELEGVYWRLETLIKKLEGRRGILIGANGGIYAIRKELFNPVSENTIVEDFVIPLLILERGFAVIYEEQAVAYEYTSKSLSDEHIRKIRIGAGAYQALTMTLPMLNVFSIGLPSFAYWSHKVIRWMTPFLLILLLVCNIMLFEKPFYFYLYYSQAALYLGAFIGFVLGRRARRLRIFHFAYYFISMNWCLLVGFFKFVAKTQQVTWQKAGR